MSWNRHIYLIGSFLRWDLIFEGHGPELGMYWAPNKYYFILYTGIDYGILTLFHLNINRCL